jgi:uncharacterized repeat protein (TIGR01451 family)
MRHLPIWLVFIFVGVVPMAPHMCAGLLAQGEAGCPGACALLAPMVPYLPPPLCQALEGGVCQQRTPPPEPCDPPTPVVKLRVRVPACGAPGAPIEYRIHVVNDSSADALNVVVKNGLPANARFVRASPEPHAKEPELEWRLGTLKGGGCIDIDLVLAPTDLEDVRNCTRVSFEHGQCVTTRVAAAGEQFPPPPGKVPEVVPIPKAPTEKEPATGKTPPEKKAAAPADKLPELALSINGPKTQYLNLAARYFVTVTNKGKAAATNLLVDFTLADKTVFLKASDDGKYLLGKVAWVLGTLEPGASRDVVVELKSPVPGELCHKALALADNNVKAQAQLCTLFSGVSALLLEMVDTEDPIPVGGTTSYPILIRNTGTAPVSNVRLKAIVPAAVTFTSAKAPVKYNLGEPLPGASVVVFEPLPALEPGAQADYTIFVQGAQPADVRFRIEMRADQLESGPVIEEESTRVYREE